MPPPVFRFAPSPNGYLHLGHAYSALLNFDLARQAGGRFLLRIEDIDAARCKPEFETAMYETWPGSASAGSIPVRRQSEHLADYRAALEDLSAQGLVYPSFESRAEIAGLVAQREAHGRWPRDPDGAPHYPGSARLLSPDERARLLESDVPYALRLDMAAACARAGNLGWTERGEGPDGETGTVAARPQAWGDVILARKETPTSYHLSVAIDDALQGVTEVVRGQDLFWSTSGASPAAAAARPATAGLPAPRSHPRRCGTEAVEIDRGHRSARIARRGATPAEIRRLVGLP
jgi:glutamyl-Q tRNA(Asp) synthetase